MKNSQTFNRFYSSAIQILPFFIMLLLLIYRAQYSFDWSDESYSAALGYRLFSGQNLFVDMKEEHQLFGLFIAPLIWAYKTISGSMDGLLLFLRIFGCLVSTFTAIIFYKTSITFSGKIPAIFTSLCIQAYSPFQVPYLHYNTLLFTFFVLCVICIVNARISRYTTVFFVFSGSCFALGVIAYPPFIISLPAFVISIIYQTYSRDKRYFRPVLYFFIGGALITVLLLIYIALTAGFSNLISGIIDVTSTRLSPDYAVDQRNRSFLSLLSEITVKPQLYANLYLLSATMAAFGYILRKLNKIFVPQLFYCVTITLLFFQTIRVAGGIFKLSLNQEYMYTSVGMIFLSRISIWIPILVLANPTKLSKSVFVFCWIPGIVLSFSVYSFAAFTIVENFFPMALCGICTIFCLFEGLPDLNIENKIIRICASKLLPLAFASIILLTVTFSRYYFVYRDEPMTSMRTKISDGYAKGIITSEQSEKNYMLIYDDMNTHIDPNESALVLGFFSVGYMLTEAMPATPAVYRSTTEDISFRDYYIKTPSMLPNVIYSLDWEYQRAMNEPRNSALIDFFVSIGYKPERTSIATIYRKLV